MANAPQMAKESQRKVATQVKKEAKRSANPSQSELEQTPESEEFTPLEYDPVAAIEEVMQHGNLLANVNTEQRRALGVMAAITGEGQSPEQFIQDPTANLRAVLTAALQSNQGPLTLSSAADVQVLLDRMEQAVGTRAKSGEVSTVDVVKATPEKEVIRGQFRGLKAEERPELGAIKADAPYADPTATLVKVEEQTPIHDFYAGRERLARKNKVA